MPLVRTVTLSTKVLTKLTNFTKSENVYRKKPQSCIGQSATTTSMNKWMQIAAFQINLKKATAVTKLMEGEV